MFEQDEKFKKPMRLLLTIALLCLLVACSSRVGRKDVQIQGAQFVNPPAWIRGSWHNSKESFTGAFTRFTFLEGDVIYTRGFPGTSEFFGKKFNGCEVQERFDAERYSLEISPTCGGEIYEFKQLKGVCGLPADRIALGYTVRKGSEVIHPFSTSCQEILTFDPEWRIRITDQADS